ncbi:GNAT family N-acetyltransferase [Micromonospora sediminicola]|uniref:GNAT family N-acetyltransferase n=1 Tax=Micromonospora sediminicola TaxID=946078 RepID=UPI00379A3BA4
MAWSRVASTRRYDERIEQPGHPLPQAWIYLIGVRPEAQRKGVGAALMRYFAEQAAMAGCSFVALLPDQSDDDVPNRLAFFRSCGLKPLVDSDPEDVQGAPLADLLARLPELPGEGWNGRIRTDYAWALPMP